FRTYCVPSISALLDRTGEFHARPQRRYDDTDLIVSELMEWGYDSERGRRALRRMNRLHGRFEIADDDFLYVLSTFIYQPIRWNAGFGWRPMGEVERLGYFHFWRAVGARMNIRDIPDDYPTFEQFNRDYERERFRFAESNRRVGAATRELFVGWFPRPLAPVVRPAIHALLDDTLLEAFGFPPAPWLLRWLVPARPRLRPRCLPPPAPRPPPPPPARDAASQLSRRLHQRVAGAAPRRGAGPALRAGRLRGCDRGGPRLRSRPAGGPPRSAPDRGLAMNVLDRFRLDG